MRLRLPVRVVPNKAQQLLFAVKQVPVERRVTIGQRRQQPGLDQGLNPLPNMLDFAFELSGNHASNNPPNKVVGETSVDDSSHSVEEPLIAF